MVFDQGQGIDIPDAIVAEAQCDVRRAEHRGTA